MKHPVRTGIQSLYRTGEGLGVLDGKPFRLPGGLPGEEVEAVRIGGGQSQSYGRIVKVLKESPDRVQPPCPVADTCGGCGLQHWNVDAQRRWKVGQIESLLKENGELHIPIEEVRSVSASQGFRNKGLWMIEEGDSGCRLGLFRLHSHHLQPLSECPVQDAVSNRILQELDKTLKSQTFQGALRAVLVRCNGSEALLTWIVREAGSFELQERLVDIGRALPGVAGVFWNRSPEEGNVLLGRDGPPRGRAPSSWENRSWRLVGFVCSNVT